MDQDQNLQLGNEQQIPVTVLSGYLGVGKTTLLNYILHNQQGLKVAVIVNDMSEVNVDAQLIKSGASLSRTEEQLVEMTNGCICCTLRDDLLQEVQRLAQTGQFDYILIESTGIGEPIPVAQTFTYVDEDQDIDLSQICRLDTMVTVVDAYAFWHDYASGETLLDRNQAVNEEDVRDVVDLLIDQIEFCDVLILNKCDMIAEEDRQALRGILHKLQPTAKIIESNYGQIDPELILNTRLFDFEKASQAPGWIMELQQDGHTPETDEYGIGSMVYRSQRPFHPERLALWLQEFPAEVVRSKGIMWLASRTDTAVTYSQAGASIQLGPAGKWLAAMPEQERQETLAEEPEWLDKWHPQWGDRMTEVVFIGMELNHEQNERSLDQCLLTEAEMSGDWSKLPDPLPQWQEIEQEPEELNEKKAEQIHV